MAEEFSKTQHVRVGVGVLVQDPLHPGYIFAGKRKGSHGAGTLALPGGHLEMYESWQECASREVKEEMGLHIHEIRLAYVTNDPMPAEDKHYVTIFMTAKCAEETQRPQNMEPHKCEGWNSYSLKDLKGLLQEGTSSETSLFGPLKQLVEDTPTKVLEVFGM